MTASPPTVLPPRVLLHLAGRRRSLVDSEDVYCLEADGDDTLVRLRVLPLSRAGHAALLATLR